MTELERLKADLEVLERYDQSIYLDDIRRGLRDKIARIEAAEADPWRQAKEWVQSWRGSSMLSDKQDNIISYVDHLEAEVERLTKRVAELEAGGTRTAKHAETVPLQPVDRSDELDDVLGDDDPELDPARVLLTAIGILANLREFRTSASVSDAFFRLGMRADRPYRLKGEKNG